MDSRSGREDKHPGKRFNERPSSGLGDEGRDPYHTTRRNRFIDGEGISREILQRRLSRYLGPEARCIPSMYNV